MVVAGLSGSSGVLAGDSVERVMETGEDIAEGRRDVESALDGSSFYPWSCSRDAIDDT
jgi:hypothetical protein